MCEIEKYDYLETKPNNKMVGDDDVYCDDGIWHFIHDENVSFDTT